MRRTALCLSILSSLVLLTAQPAPTFEALSVHPAGPRVHARDPASARCPGWDDVESLEQGNSEDSKKVLLQLMLAVAKDPTDARACLTLAKALRAAGRDAEARRQEDQADNLSGFCLVRSNRDT